MSPAMPSPVPSPVSGAGANRIVQLAEREGFEPSDFCYVNSGINSVCIESIHTVIISDLLENLLEFLLRRNARRAF